MHDYRILIYLPLENIKDLYEYFIIQYLCQSNFSLKYCASFKGEIVQLIVWEDYTRQPWSILSLQVVLDPNTQSSFLTLRKTKYNKI